ncbi:hypothetical protein JAAARDRAFT_192325 [Jaapia argillacea MUCL 33604]|uniref:Uncharacterized protein n=1 Tax=Jaapia argillacea MUCL 33604 TaxID=933084 RepID=A0A067PYR1_9AGAM|nr:hypothetical protein JAAARDRAFT_192325 [Jaapia argillacea MUCL 33604]
MGKPLQEIASNPLVFNGTMHAGDSEAAMLREELNRCESREDALKRRLKSVLGYIQSLKQDLEESKEKSHALQRALNEAQSAQAKQIADDHNLHEALSVRMDLGMEIQHLEDALVESELSREEQVEIIQGLRATLESAREDQTKLSREHQEAIGKYKRESDDRLTEAYAVRTAQEQQIQSLQATLGVVRSERDIALQELCQVLAKRAEEQEIGAQALQQGENTVQARAKEIDTLKHAVEALKTEQVHREQEFFEVDAEREVLEEELTTCQALSADQETQIQTLRNELSASRSDQGRLSHQLYVTNISLSFERNALQSLQRDLTVAKAVHTRMDEDLQATTDLLVVSRQTVEALQKELFTSQSDKVKVSQDLSVASHALVKQKADMQEASALAHRVSLEQATKISVLLH